MNSKRIIAVTACALLTLLAIFSSAVFAHHSRAHYGKEEMTTTGTVVEYKWRNPHVFVVWDAVRTHLNALFFNHTSVY